MMADEFDGERFPGNFYSWSYDRKNWQRLPGIGFGLPSKTSKNAENQLTRTVEMHFPAFKEDTVWFGHQVQCNRSLAKSRPTRLLAGLRWRRRVRRPVQHRRCLGQHRRGQPAQQRRLGQRRPDGVFPTAVANPASLVSPRWI